MKIILFCLFNFACLSQALANSNLRTSVIPLDASTEKALKNTNVAEHVRKFGDEDLKFQTQVDHATDAIAPMLGSKYGNIRLVVYDCLFMLEIALVSKYSKK